MVSQQLTVSEEVSENIEQMQAIGNENQQHANTLVNCSKELSTMVDQMHKQLNIYKV
jgi:methyl-accepting chemotaxis protein